MTAAPTRGSAAANRGGLTRRRLLGGAAGLGAAALLDPAGIAAALARRTDPRRAPARRASSAPPRVAIVGAGLAGLTCAYRLHRRGIPCTLFEAHPRRVGGRCWTARGFAAAQTAEHGGEFIDTVQHRIRALAGELELTLDDLEAAQRKAPGLHPRLVLGGKARRFAEVYGAQHLIGARARADSRRIRSFAWDRATPAARALDEMSAAEWLDQALPGSSHKLLRAATEQFMAEEYGLDVGRLSAIAMLIQFGSFGVESDERFHVHGGNDQIAWGLAERLPPGTLQLDRPLSALRRRGSGFALSFAGVPGETLADVVVLCLPFTALRRVDLDAAGLGARKRRCIEELGMGTNAKLLLQFRRHLSHYDRFDGEFYDEHVDTWCSSIDEPGRPGLLTVFSGGSYGAAQRGHGPHGPAPRGRVRTALARVGRAVPGLAAGFDGRAWLDHWASDPWTHGSYAAFEPGQYTRYWGFVGRPEGRILFGGEHTALAAQGFLDGAVASGERCAQEVAALT
ncbi:MAG TPA: FAD-dependent oxidoreductase [Solirubrobacterales bacterium]|nr:FAD-dependent oxidoreductase [Solirubrobacterales bacterium]